MPQTPYDNVNQYINDILLCVASFNIDTQNYNLYTPKQLGIKGDESNEIYLKGKEIPIGIDLVFTEKAKNCAVFIEDGIKAKGTRIALKNENNFLYLGKNSTMNNVGAVILGRGDFIVLGEGISITNHNTWSTGFNSGKSNNGLIIGDHCLIASEIVIRPADGHLVIDIETGQQVNVSQQPIIIEPYCWISQRVSILKNVRIGACSILSLGAVVTKSCERFSVASGVPAKISPLNGKMWLRGPGKEAKLIQQHYLKRFYSTISSTPSVEEVVSSGMTNVSNDKT